MLINPSANIGSPIGWQANIVSAGVFVENNYMYIDNATIPRIIKYRDNIGPSLQVEPEGNAQNYDLTYDFFTTSRKKFFSMNADVMGPAVSIHRNNFSLGIFTRARSIVSIKDVPSSLNYYNVQDLDDGQVLNINSGSIGAMAWSEIGLNYAHRVKNGSKGSFDIGGNVKFLQGFEADYFTAESNHVIINREETMEFRSLDIKSGYASSFENGNSLQVLGYGVGMDIGFTYKSHGNNDELPYRWKIGASMKDFGIINFTKEAYAHNYDVTDSFNIDKSIFDDADDRGDLYSTLSTLVYNDPAASQTSDQFGMWLPLAFSVQAEYAFTKNIFVNALMVRDIPLPIPGVRAENIWAITPRYETKWFEVNLPVVLYNGNDLRFGASVKLGYLTIGSDNLNSFMVKERETGTDIYVALKISPHKLFNADKSGNAKRLGSRGKKTKSCYSF